jgi:hypothetical protein
MAVFNEAFYGYHATPRSGWFVLGIGLVASGGDAQLPFWYLARGSVRSLLGESKGAAWPLPGKTKLNGT